MPLAISCLQKKMVVGMVDVGMGSIYITDCYKTDMSIFVKYRSVRRFLG